MQVTGATCCQELPSTPCTVAVVSLPLVLFLSLFSLSPSPCTVVFISSLSCLSCSSVSSHFCRSFSLSFYLSVSLSLSRTVPSPVHSAAWGGSNKPLSPPLLVFLCLIFHFWSLLCFCTIALGFSVCCLFSSSVLSFLFFRCKTCGFVVCYVVSSCVMR